MSMGFWTDERVEQLKIAWDNGHSASQIAAMAEFKGATRNAIIGKANRLGLSSRAGKKWHRPRPPSPAAPAAALRRQA